MDKNELAKVTFSQLWETEKSTLATLATEVPANGVIVEIGTAQGGSSYIMSKATEVKGVSILSFDISTSLEAFQHLTNTNVKLFTMPSVEGANRWRDLCDEKIDMLLIDGSHAFQHVFEDIQMWIPLMQPGGKVIFHDYDSDERGGLVHFGTEVALKALLKTSFLCNPVHSDRFLYGSVEKPTDLDFTLQMCLDAFKNIGNDIIRLVEEDFSSWNLIGNEIFAKLISTTMNINISKVSSLSESISTGNRCLIFERPLGPLLEKISEYEIPPENYLVINSLQACYLLEKGLSKNRDIMLDFATDRKEFFGIEEKLFMFHHAFGCSDFPDQVNDLSVKSAAELSVIIAREQIRLGLLAELLEVLLGWKS